MLNKLFLKFYKLTGQTIKYHKLLFKITMGYKLDLDNPKTYNEKLNWIKFRYYNPLYEVCSDKIEVRKYIEKLGYKSILTKCYKTYEKVKDFTKDELDKLPNKFVIKTTHSSGGVVVCKNKADFDYEHAMKILIDSSKKNLYYELHEWQYKNIKPRLIVEELIESDKPELTDYKFFCFNGKVKGVYIAYGTTSGVDDYYMDFYDENWNWINVKRVEHKNYGPINKPDKFEKMKKIAEDLSKEFEHVRVDLYCENSKIYFGELTFTTAAGLGRFNDYNYDLKLGSFMDTERMKEKNE